VVRPGTASKIDDEVGFDIHMAMMRCCCSVLSLMDGVAVLHFNRKRMNALSFSVELDINFDELLSHGEVFENAVLVEGALKAGSFMRVELLGVRLRRLCLIVRCVRFDALLLPC
jgi:hypothetical protein